MAFTTEKPIVPGKIGCVRVVLTDFGREDVENTAEYEVQILQADGSFFRLATGDLVSHLSAAQINGLQALMTDLRTKAQKLLP